MLSNPFIQNDVKKMIENEKYEENALMQRKSYVKSEEELARQQSARELEYNKSILARKLEFEKLIAE